MTTSVNEYKAKSSKTFNVTLKSGVVFEIYEKIKTRTAISKLENIPLTSEVYESEEKRKIMKEKNAKKMTTEDFENRKNFMNKLIVLAVKAPALSLEPCDDKICVCGEHEGDLMDDDWNELISIVSDKSLGGAVTDPLAETGGLQSN